MDQSSRYADLSLREDQLIRDGRHILVAYTMKPKAGVAKVPQTCGSCHKGIMQEWRESAHGTVWKDGSRNGKEGPVCTTCHTYHVPPPSASGPTPVPEGGPPGALLGPLLDTAGQADRKQAMDEASKNLLAEIVAKKGEDPERFKLRKKWVEQQMEELTRFYVEAARIHLNWFTKVQEKNASLHLELQALTGTPLAGSVDELGKVAGAFSGVPHAEDQPLSLHVNFPLDQLRQDNIREMAQLAHPIALKEIGEDKELSDSQKKHATTVSNVMNDIVEEVVKAKVLDTFVNVTGTDKQVAVGGLKLNGAAIRASLDKHKGDAEVKFDVEKVGDVAIHSIKIPADQAELLDVFGKDAVFHLATGQNAIWYSIGEGGTAAIKQAIEQGIIPGPRMLVTTRAIVGRGEVDVAASAPAPGPRDELLVLGVEIRDLRARRRVEDLRADRHTDDHVLAALAVLVLAATVLGDQLPHRGVGCVDAAAADGGAQSGAKLAHCALGGRPAAGLVGGHVAQSGGGELGRGQTQTHALVDVALRVVELHEFVEHRRLRLRRVGQRQRQAADPQKLS